MFQAFVSTRHFVITGCFHLLPPAGQACPRSVCTRVTEMTRHSSGWVKTGWLFTTGVLLLLSHLACLHLSFWFCLAFCLFFNLFASYSVPIGLPVANHPNQLLTICHVLFWGTYVLLTSVDSEPWDIAVLIPEVFVVYDDLKQYHHPNSFLTYSHPDID